jgi:hypothetical protein
MTRPRVSGSSKSMTIIRGVCEPSVPHHRRWLVLVETLVPRIVVALVLDAFEAARIRAVADLEARDLREEAERALELDAARGTVVHVVSRNDLMRRYALLNPPLECFKRSWSASTTGALTPLPKTFGPSPPPQCAIPGAMNRR